ncbi:branched-chain amino acid ABC transporter permease [Aerococcus urinaehominis]|uniref:Branched-chain amino acid ABC transporter permease n=1 Tax=Aerococcus urinaehominis TaxID=128944 RepID=A0A0X8FLE1_9LACT|nr:branched-chain amino acid ABC transporter permease [Aerococcus urinaehominis]AMB99450.1 branched-chain amino acid ABC transporter permease [Aerococcus urinaehominis]SDM28571.1 branched-chain amino acid transport system permease protein [Aerococcus urinaehominis]
MKKRSWFENFFTPATNSWLVSILALFTIIITIYLTGNMTTYNQNIMITIGINMILAIGLNLVVGYSGQFSLGHAGFMAIGAYAGAITSMKVPGLMGMYLGMIVGAVLAAIVALIVGIPTLRLKGDYLAIATLGTSEIIRVIIMNLEVTNGAAGLTGIPQNTDWIILFCFIVATSLVILNYVNSSPGRATISVREDEIAAESVGVNATRAKIVAFVIGAITAAIAGTLYASYFTVITPSQFTFQKSIDILIIVVFGGIGSITGSFVAAIVLGLLNTVLAPFGQLRMIVYAIALIVIMIFRPAGLLGDYEFRFSRLFKKKEEV